MSQSTGSIEDFDEIEDDERWTEGDFELISSDNVRFKIPSYYLLAHSSVFRDAEGLVDGEKRLEFTDQDYEKSSTLRRFLEIASDGAVGEISFGMFELFPLVLFLKKYDCSPALRILLGQIGFKMHHDPFFPFGPFVIGALADDDKMCLAALAAYEIKWPDAPVFHWLPHKYAFDPSSFPLWSAQLIPFPYYWAVSRAWGLVGCSQDLPGEFSTQLALAKQYEEDGHTRLFFDALHLNDSP